jgi:histidinol-phosphatase (PHP family)
MLASYHNHSTYSDGKASLSELVAAAARLGIDELGVSDHFLVHPGGEEPSWAMPRRRLGDYLAELRQHAGEAHRRAGPVVRIGLEVDWFPGHAAAIRSVIDPLPLDYVIGSVHYVGQFTIDGSPQRWAALNPQQRDEIHQQYWRRMRELAESGVFDIVAHIDLSKKFGYFPTTDLRELIGDALDAIAAAGMVVELNTSGWHKPCADAYPALEILKECFKREIPVTLSADAHQPDHLLRDFDRGAARLAEAGYDRVARFAGREVRMEDLAGAAPALR